MDSNICTKICWRNRLPYVLDKDWAEDVLSDDEIDLGEKLDKEVEKILDGVKEETTENKRQVLMDDLTSSFKKCLNENPRKKEKKVMKELMFLHQESEWGKKGDFLQPNENVKDLSRIPEIFKKPMTEELPPLFIFKKKE